MILALPVSESLWKLSQPWWEFVLRAGLVYLFLLVLLRLTGKRQVGQLSPFDLVLLLVLSNAVQNSMNAGDNTLLAGFILAASLVALNRLVGWISFRSRGAAKLLEGSPVLLVHNGVLNEAKLTAERLTHHELMAALRQAGLTELSQVHVAILEPTGRIDVIARKG